MLLPPLPVPVPEFSCPSLCLYLLLRLCCPQDVPAGSSARATQAGAGHGPRPSLGGAAEQPKASAPPSQGQSQGPLPGLGQALPPPPPPPTGKAKCSQYEAFQTPEQTTTVVLLAPDACRCVWGGAGWAVPGSHLQASAG